MAADIKIEGRVAIIKAKPFRRSICWSHWSKSRSCLILAALAAEGESKISKIEHMDRGYENLHVKLANQKQILLESLTSYSINDPIKK